MTVFPITERGKALYTLYLPLNGNDGQPLPADRLRRGLEEIRHVIGGYTLLPPGDGVWVDGTGRVYHDRVVAVQVVAPAGGEAWRFFARLAGDLATLLGQHEVFVHVVPVAVVDGPEVAVPL